MRFVKDFINIRHAICSLLTVEHSRRGNEVARLTLEELGESTEKDGGKLVHAVGKKTSTFVPILIHSDLVPAMSLFVDKRVRKGAKIRPSNIYVFSSLNSDDHVCGHRK